MRQSIDEENWGPNSPVGAGFTLVELLTVIAVIATLAAILYPALIVARGKGHETQDISNLRTLGIANSLYQEDSGPTIDTRQLVVYMQIPLTCLISSTDPTPMGYANAYRQTDGSSDQVTTYKDSYLPLSAAGSRMAAQLILASSNPGWLVAFSGSYDKLSLASPAYTGVTPILEGMYLRLMMDSSVAVRHGHIRHHYPSSQLENFQNPLWFFTDDDNAVEPHA